MIKEKKDWFHIEVGKGQNKENSPDTKYKATIDDIAKIHVRVDGQEHIIPPSKNP